MDHGDDDHEDDDIIFNDIIKRYNGLKNLNGIISPIFFIRFNAQASNAAADDDNDDAIFFGD